MHSERWQSCAEIFNAAVEQPPNERAAFLDRSCDGDEALRRKVELLLKYHDTSGDFIKSPAFEVAPELLVGDPESLIGQHLGCYRVEAVAGVGGMGVVYLASDERLGRKVALKLLPESMVANEAELRRLECEARTASALNHPNIVTIHEIGEVNSTHYVATEFIEGTTLRERMKNGSIPLDEALDIATQVASALCAAHRAGIVHRDIKPENIMLRPDGYVKVLDFGIAKLMRYETLGTTTLTGVQPATQQGVIVGTTRYMSPEQTMAQAVDARSDIWSLGVVLYEMVTGRAPFTSDTPGEVMSSILDKEPLPLTNYVAHTPAELQQIISKTLRKDREERYHSAHDLLEALKGLRHKLEVEVELARSAAAPSWLRWIRSPAALALGFLIAAVALALPFYWHRNLTTGPLPEKSIAVLPFENLSKDEENAFFAGGVQDEILTDLAKVADLKVISRTSVMKYKSDLERNLREIAKALGVSYVVEGSVQRAGERVRVSAQLIDARNDTHLWAEHYDRDFADIFVVQSEIAQRIADQLKVNLSLAEKAAIAERPTADLVAYAYYTKAKELDLGVDWEGAEKSANQKVELLEKATQRDPNFALAYCALAKAQIDFYSLIGEPENRKHLELAKKAAEAALQVRPDLGEAHLELARYYFYAVVLTNDYHDYDRARDELAVARRTLPNNAEALVLEARIGRHQNRWDASLANLQKASELDPRNGEIPFYLGQIYLEMRRYNELEQLWTKQAANRILDNLSTQSFLAWVMLAQGDPVAAQSLLEQVPLDFSPTAQIWDTRFTAALYLRDYDAANRVIAATPAKWADFAFGEQTSSWAEGQVARARGDKQKALAAFAAARNKLEAKFGDIPKDAIYLSEVATLDAGLGRKEDAIRNARHAVELLPIAKDSLNGPTLVANLALVYAWTGERARALDQLEIVATIPGEAPAYGDLLLNPCWDDLRADKRFDKIVAAAKAASR
jgi:serine/threonine protein kinase/tetratricopeptide (TPR) repeat protein